MATTAAAHKSPRGLSVDPALQAIFDAMTAFMGSEFTSMNCTLSQTSTGTNETCNLVDVTGETTSVTHFTPGPKVTVTPAGANLGPGGTQQFTASAANPDGSPIATPGFVWSVVAGSQGTIDANGLYTAPASISASTSASCKCQLTGSQAAMMFTVTLHP